MTLTSRQISEKYGNNLESWQHDANEAFIQRAWNMLKTNGIWIWPDIELEFQKVDGGWIRSSER